MTTLNYIDLNADGGTKILVPLNDVVVTLQTKYNYSAECWVMDICDAQDEPLALGIMLVPDIDLLIGYTALKEQIGSLVLIEKARNDYKDPDSLGNTTKLLWFAPGEDIVY